MIKDIQEVYDIEDKIAELKVEVKENRSARKFKELNYYLWLKETLEQFE